MSNKGSANLSFIERNGIKLSKRSKLRQVADLLADIVEDEEITHRTVEDEKLFIKAMFALRRISKKQIGPLAQSVRASDS